MNLLIYYHGTVVDQDSLEMRMNEVKRKLVDFVVFPVPNVNI